MQCSQHDLHAADEAGVSAVEAREGWDQRWIAAQNAGIGCVAGVSAGSTESCSPQQDCRGRTGISAGL
eukprot:scaffold23024_cov19-Tisochrysis_lutea.AAC.2